VKTPFTIPPWSDIELNATGHWWVVSAGFTSGRVLKFSRDPNAAFEQTTIAEYFTKVQSSGVTMAEVTTEPLENVSAKCPADTWVIVTAICATITLIVACCALVFQEPIKQYWAKKAQRGEVQSPSTPNHTIVEHHRTYGVQVNNYVYLSGFNEEQLESD
jgi:hypothetical protein